MAPGGIPPFGGGAAPATPPPGAQGWSPAGAGAPPQQAGWSGAGAQPQVGWQSAGQFGQQSGQSAGQMAGQMTSDGKKGKSKRKRVIMISAAVLVILALVGAGLGYFLYRATAPTSFVIATDRGKGEIDRIDIATRSVTVLIKSDKLQNSPDSIVFLSDNLVLIDFVSGGQLGLGDIAAHSYTTVSQNHGQLRDMAALPDGSGALVAEQDTGTILRFRLADRSLTTLVQADFLRGVQGLAFDNDGNLYAAVGGTVYQLDPGNGRQIKKFDVPGGSDGMAYDKSRSTLDVAAGEKIQALDPKTGKVSTVIDGVGDADGVAIDRRGNLFIASNVGVLELSTSNQLLIVGTNSNGVLWDDVAPLSGSGAANY
ncbi:MAG TPA: hypothetical protein VH540_25065 [Ktedonobacterales bacterium]